MYFGTYTPLLSLALKTSEMSRHSKPDSLSFVRQLGLPLSTVPENYIGNHSSPIVQSLKNMFICSSSNLSAKIVVVIRKKTTQDVFQVSEALKQKDIQSGSSERNGPPIGSAYTEQ